MEKPNGVDFQIFLSLCSGLLFGPLSSSILITIVFVFIYEFALFHYSSFFPPKVKALDRVLCNIFFFFGWILGRKLLLNELGIEGIFESMYPGFTICQI